MFRKMNRGALVARGCWQVIGENRRLLWFPLISFAGLAAILLSFFLPLWGLRRSVMSRPDMILIRDSRALLYPGGTSWLIWQSPSTL